MIEKNILPGLPLFIRDKYSGRLTRDQNIFDFKSEILVYAEEFLAEKKETMPALVPNVSQSFDSKVNIQGCIKFLI